MFNVNNRYVDDTDLLIKSNTGSRLNYSAVLPNEKYRLTFTATADGYIYEADDFSVNTNLTRLKEFHTGENNITVTPTKTYIVFIGKDENLNTITSNISIYFVSTKDLFELKNNIFIRDNRVLNYSDSKIYYNTSYKIRYMKVVPNNYYIFIMRNPGATKYLCETDNLAIGIAAIRLQYISITGSAFYIIKPTKNYIVWDSTMEIASIQTPGDSDLVFGGVVKNSGNIDLNPRYPHYATLQLLDFETFLSEGDTLNYVLERQSYLEIIKTIVNDLKGFMLGNVEVAVDEELGPYNCNEKTPYDVFKYIAEMTGALWYTQTISKDITLIHFYSTDNLPKADNIEYSQEYFENNNIVDIKYTYDTKNYRNKQVITSDDVQSNVAQVEYLTYEGGVLKVSYPISSIVSIKKGTKSYSVAQNRAGTTGEYAYFYYTFNDNDITVNYDFRYGTVFRVEYYANVTSRQVAYNQDEIERISTQTNHSGIISRYEKREDVSNEVALSKIAQTYLDFKGVPEIQVTVNTYKKDLFKLGNVVFFNAPIGDLKTNYLVIGKKVTMITTGNNQEIFYEYTLSSSFNDENAINYFDNQRRKLIGDIKEGEYIPRYIDLPSSTNIVFYDLDFTEMESSKNILDGELEMEI